MTMKKVYEVMKKVSEWLASFGADRWLHLIAGLIIAFGASMLVRGVAEEDSRWLCALLGLTVAAAVGLLKEVADQSYEGESDGVDWLFTVIGGVVGCGLWLI